MEQFNNFAYGVLTSAPNNTNTSITLQSGEGARFPATSFYAVLWDYESYTDASEAYQNSKGEIVAVTTISTDTLTIIRAQKGTSAIDFTGSSQVRIGQTLLAHNIDELVQYNIVSSNYTASRGEKIAADTSGGSFTITLPSSPSNGGCVNITDPNGNWGTNNLTIDGNGNNIEGASTFTADVNDYLIYVIYNGTQWEVK